MKVKVCVHYPLNPKKAKRCIELEGHFARWITELDLPFVDDLNLTAWSLTNMASCDDISDDDIPKLYDAVKDEFLSKSGPETEALF